MAQHAAADLACVGVSLRGAPATRTLTAVPPLRYGAGALDGDADAPGLRDDHNGYGPHAMILRLELLHNPANMVCLNWFQATFGGTLYPIAGRNPIDQVVYPGYMSAWDVRSAAALALASQLMDFSIAKKQNYEVIGANYPLCRWCDYTTPDPNTGAPIEGNHPPNAGEVAARMLLDAELDAYNEKGHPPAMQTIAEYTTYLQAAYNGNPGLFAWYLAGLTDADGCLGMCKRTSLQYFGENLPPGPPGTIAKYWSIAQKNVAFLRALRAFVQTAFGLPPRSGACLDRPPRSRDGIPRLLRRGRRRRADRAPVPSQDQGLQGLLDHQQRRERRDGSPALRRRFSGQEPR